MGYRVGFSKDIHRLVYGSELILAGVHIPHWQGLLAHSDGDVVYHAVAESILGALALGDLGKHFPDTSEETKDMDSSIIVSKVVEMMNNLSYRVENIDVFISCEQPKLKPHIEQMRNNIAKLLEVDINQVSVKAGTNEMMGPVGRMEAIEAYSQILLYKE